MQLSLWQLAVKKKHQLKHQLQSSLLLLLLTHRLLLLHLLLLMQLLQPHLLLQPSNTSLFQKKPLLSGFFSSGLFLPLTFDTQWLFGSRIMASGADLNPWASFYRMGD